MKLTIFAWHFCRMLLCHANMPSKKQQPSVTTKTMKKTTKKMRTPCTPVTGAQKRMKRTHFRRDNVPQLTNTPLRQLKQTVAEEGCEICGKPLVDENGNLLPDARLDHQHIDKNNPRGAIRGWLCNRCNTIEGVTKNRENADSVCAKVVRRRNVNNPPDTEKVRRYRSKRVV